jgi:DNA-binding transcriptional regulator LsrR (DeoR family)
MEYVSGTPSNYQEYNAELRILLIRRGLTQAQLADKLGVRREYLNRILVGAKAGYHIRVRLVREFGFPDWILDVPQQSRKAA